MLTEALRFDKITITPGGWLICPICGNKSLKRVHPDEEAAKVYIYCRKCKHEIPIKLKQGQSLKGQGQR